MEFKQQIETLTGHSTNLCFQCSKCSTGCPSADKMDLKPAQVMHSIRLGWEEAVLNSEAIWLCIGCDTCSARCPQQVEPSSIMAAARLLAMQKGIQPRVREIGIYYQGFMYNMRLNGKIHDASLAGVTQLLSGQLIENLPLAWKLFKRGRVKLPLPPFGGGDFRRIYNNVVDKEKENKL